jgi:HlyD family secretion protein
MRALRLERIIAAIAGAAIAGFLVWAFLPRPIAVTTEPVTRGPLRVAVEAEAKTRVKQRYIVSAPVSGRLERVPWKEGQVVRAGAVIARIEPVEYNAAIAEASSRIAAIEAQRSGVETLRPKPEALAQAEARISSARANRKRDAVAVELAKDSLAQSQREFTRVRDLEARGYAPHRSLELAELDAIAKQHDLRSAQYAASAADGELAASEAGLAELRSKLRDADYLYGVYGAQIAEIRAELVRLRNDARNTEIRAPVSGSVLRVQRESAQYVAAGTPIVEIGDPRTLEIVADLLSSDAVGVRAGAPVTVLRGAGSRTLRARVRTVEPSGYTKISALGIEEQRVNVIADFLDDTSAIGDGYRLDVSIQTWYAPSVLRVPTSALFRCAEAWCAYTERSGRARSVKVTIGHRSDSTAEVLAGLEPGERVIVQPPDAVHDGAAIR